MIPALWFGFFAWWRALSSEFAMAFSRFPSRGPTAGKDPHSFLSSPACAPAARGLFSKGNRT